MQDLPHEDAELGLVAGGLERGDDVVEDILGILGRQVGQAGEQARQRADVGVFPSEAAEAVDDAVAHVQRGFAAEYGQEKFLIALQFERGEYVYRVAALVPDPVSGQAPVMFVYAQVGDELHRLDRDLSLETVQHAGYRLAVGGELFLGGRPGQQGGGVGGRDQRRGGQPLEVLAL